MKTFQKNFSPETNDLHNMILAQLILEMAEFGELEDTRENIEAPIDQIYESHRPILTELHKLGIHTTDDVDQLSNWMQEAYDSDSIYKLRYKY